MGGWLSIAMAVTAAALTWAGEHRVIFWLAVVAGIADVWIFGVMHNYAYGPQARRKAQLIANLKAEGADPERLRDAEQLQVRIAPRDVKQVPDALAVFSMLSTLGTIAVLLAAIVARAR